MLSLVLRVQMLAELVLWGALGWWIWGGSSWCGVLLFALLAMLVARAVGVAITFGLGWYYRSSALPLGMPAYLAMVLREYGATLLGFGLIQPFERLWLGRERLRPDAQPVLLVHGYQCNRGIWWWLRRQLRRAGHEVATLNLEPPWGDIDGFVEQLHARVEAVCAATQAAQVTLVAHSMGGLVSRAYLARHGAGRVAGLVTIGSPHRGTAVARLGVGDCARQMERGSAWLAWLGTQRVGVPFVSIRTPRDNIVMPQNSQRHPEALDEPLHGVGHVSALFHPRTLALLRQHLKPPAA